jgi:phosphoribosylaminoimidazolecarboxamide formyltransferase/IMP cyclohydrolase
VNPEGKLKSSTVKTALISVSDKSGIVELAQELIRLGVKLLSTGGTAAVLRDAGLVITDVADYTGFPEIMDGRVKTLNPMIAGGILGNRDIHAPDAEPHNIRWIDLVVCNLYPFSETIMNPEKTRADAIENIDIGGPTMIRSAAKNMEWTTVIVDPADYNLILDALNTPAGITPDLRQKLAVKAFGHCAKYDTLIYNYLKEENLPETFNLTFDKAYDLRYGENPHQKAAAYHVSNVGPGSVLAAKIHQGKQLSYNNLMDADAALHCLQEFSEPVCVIIKHGNPCGAATSKDLLDVYGRAFNADSKAAFGGIVALNRTCTAEVADEISKVFIEIVLATGYTPRALTILSKKKNMRVLELGSPQADLTKQQEFRFIKDGLLVQEPNIHRVIPEDFTVVTGKKPSASEQKDMEFAWKILKYVKSNAILTARDQTTLGIGAGQVSRIDAVDIALGKSGDDLGSAILASDAFFPFRDSIDHIATTGIKAVIQPGGSLRDGEVINACNEHKIALVFTGHRCFKH